MALRPRSLLLALAALAGVAACPSSPESVDSADGSAVELDAAVAMVPPDAGAPELGVARVEDLGAFPLPSSAVIGRDGASAGLFRGRLLWTFGDTFLAKKNGLDDSSVLSATSGWSTPAAPLALDEPVNDAGIPAQLVPYTSAELAANRADALNGWALWPGQVLDTGAAKALVLFQRIKRTNGSGFDAVGLGTARIAEGAAVAARDPNDLFSHPQGTDGGTPLYGANGVSIIDATAYFFACETVGFLNSGCKVGRVPVAKADQRAAFEFWDGSAWQSDLRRAALVIDHVSGGVSVSFNPYLKKFLAVTNKTLSSTVLLRTSPRLEGPWPAEGVEIATSDGGVLEPHQGEFDYLALEHPELRSADGKQIVISYARPLGNFRGEVRLARITLK